MKHTAILFIVNESINDLMHRLDVFHPKKVSVIVNQLSFERIAEINDEYFQRMIEVTAGTKGGFLQSGIAAIKYMRNWYFHPKVSCISTGEYEMFTPNPFRGEDDANKH